MSPTSRDPEKRATQLANLRNAPPAPPLGNQRRRTHGAYAVVTAAELDDKTSAIYEAISADAPVRTEDGGLPSHDSLVVRMLAEVMVRRERVRLEELRHGLEAPDGRIRGVVEYGLRLDAQALEMAKELGMTPSSRAKLGLDLARATKFDLAREWADADGEVVDDD